MHSFIFPYLEESLLHFTLFVFFAFLSLLSANCIFFFFCLYLPENFSQTLNCKSEEWLTMNLIIPNTIGHRFIDLSKKLWFFLTVDLSKEIAKILHNQKK